MSRTPLPKKSEEVRVRKVSFLGEQNGVPERFLKSQLAVFFRQNMSVSRAYLARVDLGDNCVGVVLALRAIGGPDKGMVQNVGTIFASIFAKAHHLDVLFLTEGQEAQVAKVCKPFFAMGGGEVVHRE